MGNLPIPCDMPLTPPASPHTRDHFAPSAILIGRSPSARNRVTARLPHVEAFEQFGLLANRDDCLNG